MRCGRAINGGGRTGGHPTTALVTREHPMRRPNCTPAGRQVNMQGEAGKPTAANEVTWPHRQASNRLARGVSRRSIAVTPCAIGTSEHGRIETWRREQPAFLFLFVGRENTPKSPFSA